MLSTPATSAVPCMEIRNWKQRLYIHEPEFGALRSGCRDPEELRSIAGLLVSTPLLLTSVLPLDYAGVCCLLYRLMFGEPHSSQPPSPISTIALCRGLVPVAALGITLLLSVPKQVAWMVLLRRLTSIAANLGHMQAVNKALY